MLNIIKRISISNQGVFLNEVNIFQHHENQTTANDLREIYRYFKIDYPKFFKMDNLSKLGFLAAEILLKEIDNKEDLGIILGTTSSSLDTDTIFQETIRDADNFFPSPSVFVYTLPNIVIGEICIRHKIYGENTMFIIHENNLEDFYQNTPALIREMCIKQGVLGYLEVYHNYYKAKLILFENQGTNKK